MGRAKHIIKSGDKFGKLTVVSDKPEQRGHSSLWKCICECDDGNEKFVYVQATDLISGHTTSCGCARREAASKKTSDLTGKVFENLIVVERLSNAPNKPVKYKCRCSCGKEIEVRHGNLQSGNTRSCGHERKTWVSRDRLHHIWVLMNRRCSNESDNAYANYGGRGISVCEEWKNDYRSFRSWALTNGYSDKLSIDRIDVNGNYEPGNCRWATEKEQANNTRNNTYINGERFGKLVVIGRTLDRESPNGSTSRMYLCKCDCGNYSIVDKYHLSSGHTKSCGCNVNRPVSVCKDNIKIIPENI